MTDDTTIIAGIDTGKASLDIALRPGGESMRADNTRTGHRDLLAFLTRHRVSLVGIEASGSYERAALAALCARPAFALSCSNPAKFGPSPSTSCGGPRTTGWMPA